MSCKCPEDSVNFTYAVSYRIRNSKPFTKVTYPLGASTDGVWVQVPSPAPNKKDAMWRLFYLVPRGTKACAKG